MTTIDTQISTDIRKNEDRVSLRQIVIVAADGFSTMINMLLDWQDRARQRRELLALGDRALQDFGASSADASAEGEKPFWQS